MTLVNTATGEIVEPLNHAEADDADLFGASA